MTESTETANYWIREGVRRTMAHVMAGLNSIQCEVYTKDSQYLGIRQIPIDQLRTTKPVIEVDNPNRLARFENIVRAVAEGKSLPPIVVEQTDRGWPVDHVELDYEGSQ